MPCPTPCRAPSNFRHRYLVKRSLVTKVQQGQEFRLKCSVAFCSENIFNNSAEEVDRVFTAYGPNTRDLYYNIIDQINHGPEILQSKQGISRINNIFCENAGIAIGDRGFKTPEGIIIFKSVGIVKADDTWPHPTLTPKAKAAPPSSPETMNRFPPGTDPNDTKGIISPTSIGKSL